MWEKEIMTFSSNTTAQKIYAIHDIFPPNISSIPLPLFS